MAIRQYIKSAFFINSRLNLVDLSNIFFSFQSVQRDPLCVFFGLSLKYGFRSVEPLKCGTTESAPNIRD